MQVKEAVTGDRVETGKIIIGAGGLQLRVAKDTRGYYVKRRSRSGCLFSPRQCC